MKKGLSRRLFFKRSGAAAAAVAVASTPSGATREKALSLAGISDLPTNYATEVYRDNSSSVPRLDYIRKQLTKLLAGDLDTEIIRSSQYVNYLEPDLIENCSMSLSAKIRIQRERNFIKSKESRKYYLSKELEELLSGE